MSNKAAVIFFALVLAFARFAYAVNSDVAVQEDISREEPAVLEIPREEPEIREAAKKVFFSSSFEYGEADFPGREEIWKVLRNRIAYLYKGLQLPYLEVRRYSRGNRKDYTYDIGGYLKFNHSYANAELGWGQDADYVYKFKALAEFTHPFFATLHLKERYKFLHNLSEDVHIVSPGFIYYFDNHYILAYYNAGINSDRGSSHWGYIKANFNFRQRLDLWLGSAFGQRLYDINESRKAHQQEGFIIFGGSKVRLNQDLSLYINLLYGEEEEDFYHRSLEARFSYKF